MKILLVLAEQNEINITALAKITSLNHTRLNEHLVGLEQLGLIYEKRFGRIRIIGFNELNEPSKRLKSFLANWQNSSCVFQVHET